jgi:hypothetical protein
MSILSQFKQSQNTDFPNVRPSLDLRFALTKKLDPRITFTRGSTGTYFGSDGIMRIAGVNEPRFDHNPITGQSLGLLVEEQKTNLVRNNTAQGAVVGTPGTNPTNSYFFIAPSGITREITSIGTENGITYFDVRYYGVSASSGELSWVPQTGTNTPITGGQVVSASAYLKVVSGTFANITNLTVRILDYNGASYLAESSTAVSASSLQSSTLARYSHTRTTGASANGVVFSISFNKNSAGPVDITLRIGMPQIELGPEPTSVIPNSSVSSTVTRTPDIANITGTNFSNWFNQNEGTFLSIVKPSYAFPSITNFTNKCPMVVYYDNNLIHFILHRSNQPQIGTRSPVNYGINVSYLGPGSLDSISERKVSYTYKDNYYNAVVNRQTTTPDIRGEHAKTANGLGLNSKSGEGYATNTRFNGLNALNGTISRLTYYPIQLTNQQLINLTS